MNENKTEPQNQEFVSPLNQYIKANCERCRDWEHQACNTQTSKGVDRMLLCMIAATCQAPPSVDNILQQAMAALEGSEKDE